MGVQPDPAYAFRGRYQGRIVFLLDPNASIQRFVDPKGGPTLINSSAGGLELWPARGDDNHLWLRFELPSWTVLVPIEVVGSSRSVELAGLAAGVGSSLRIWRNRLRVPRRRRVWGCRARRGVRRGGGRSWRSATLRPNPTWCPSWTPRSFSSPDGCTSAVDSGPSGVRGDLPRRWSSVREHLREIASSSPASSMIFASRICARRDVPHGGPADPSLASHACRSGTPRHALEGEIAGLIVAWRRCWAAPGSGMPAHCPSRSRSPRWHPASRRRDRRRRVPP